MKVRLFLLPASIVVSLFPVQPLAAAPLYWDGNESIVDSASSNTQASPSLNWLSGGNWDNGTTSAAVTAWTAADTATFGGTGGIVNLGSSLTAAGVAFTSSGYTLNLTNTTATYNLGTWTASAINAPVVNVSLGTGSATAAFGTANNFTGFTGTINVGVGQAAGAGKVLLQQTANGLNSSTTVNVTANSTLYVSANATHAASLILHGGDTGESLGQLRLDAGTWSGNVTLAGTMASGDTFIGSNSGTAIISGNIGESGGARELSKGGAGTIILTGNNTYTGGTRITGGILGFSNGSLGSTGNITMAGGTLQWNTGNAQDISNRLVRGSSTATFNTNGNDVTFASGLGSGSGAMIKTGNGTLTLSAFSSTTGGIELTGGVLSVSEIADTGTTSQIGNYSSGGNPYLAVKGGTFRYTGSASATTNRYLWIDSGGSGTIDVTDAAASLTFTGTGGNQNVRVIKSGAGTLTIDDVINSASGAVTVNAGTFNLRGVNTYTGTTVINGGTLAFTGNSGAATGVSAVTIGGGGTLRLDNSAASIADRFGTGAITMNGGNIQYFHNGTAATNYSETLGALTIASGINNVSTSQAASGQTSKLTFASLARTGGSVNFIGTGLGSSIDPRNEISFTTAPGLVGGIIGTWATINGTDLATLSGNSLISYSGYTDIDVLGSTIVDDSASNVRIFGTGSGGNIALGSNPTTINSLTMSNASTAATVATASSSLATGGVLVASGAHDLTIGAAANDGTLQVYSAGGTLTLNNQSATKALTVNAAIANNTSASGLSKFGPGLVTLAGINTYTGITSIGEGTLQVTGAGQLNSGNYAAAISNNGVFRYSSTAAQTLTGVISGNGSLLKDGTGNLVLGSSGFTGNTFTGGMTVTNGLVTIQGNNNGTSVAGAGTLTIGTGATVRALSHNPLGQGGGLLSPLFVNGGTFEGSEYNHINTITMTGGSINARSGITVVDGLDMKVYGVLNPNITTNAAAGSATISLKISNNAAPMSVAVADGAAATDLVISGVIAGSQSLTKSGAGTLQLSGANTLSGALNVSGGRALVSNAARTVSGFNVSGSGSILEFGATNIFTTGHGDPMNATRVINVDGGTLLFNTSADFRFGNVTLSNAATWTSNRVLTNYDALLANTNLGAATVNVTGTGASTMNGSGGIHLQGVQNFNVADVTGDANADLNVSMILASQGTIGGAAGGINKLGTGTLNLTGANTYNGGTNLNLGVINARVTNGQNALGTGTVALSTGTTLNLNNVNTANDTTVANLFSGDGTINLVFASGTTPRNTRINTTNALTNFSGALVLSLPSGTTGDKLADASGTTTASLTIGSGTQLYAVHASGVTFNGGITVSGTGNTENRGAIRLGTTLGGNINLAADTSIGTEGGTLSGNISTATAGTKNLTFGTANSTGNATVNGNITNGSGTIALTKTQGGTVTLTGSNNYAGNTLISGGTLQIGSGGTTGTLGSGSVTNNATLTFNRSNTLSVSNDISGSGAVVKNGGGSTTMSGTNTYAGTTSVNDGRLDITGTITSTTSVAAIAELGGDGLITGGVTLSGTLLPGQGGVADRTLTINGNVTTNAGSILSFTVDAMNNHDQLVISGANSIGLSGADLTVDFNDALTFDNLGAGQGDDFLSSLDSFAGTGSWFKLISGNSTGMFDNVTETLTSGELSYFGLSGTQYKTTIEGQSFWVAQGSIYLVAIPEPHSALLGGLGILSLFRRNRRTVSQPI